MQYRLTIPVPASVARNYPLAESLLIKGSARSGLYNVFVMPESAGPKIAFDGASGQRYNLPTAIASGIPAHRIEQSYGVFPDNPDSTD